MPPEFKNRTAESIVSENLHFESSGYIYRSLSWLDYAERTRSPVALQYAAHDLRQAIEHLLFEEILLSTGSRLTESQYKRCLGNATKLRKIINDISPHHRKLSEFVNAVMETSESKISIAVWDHDLLMRYWGCSSKYLHWSGDSRETVKSTIWLTTSIEQLNQAANYIWSKLTTSVTGTMKIDEMHPEVRALWDQYLSDLIDINQVRIRLDILKPVFGE